MFRFLTPLFILVIAIALFFVYTRPTFNETKVVESELHSYTEAIDKANQLQQRINELNAQANQFSQTDLERLNALVPDRVDEVAVIMSLDALAERHRLNFAKIMVSESADQPTEEPIGEESDFAGTQYIPTAEPASVAAQEAASIADHAKPLSIQFSVTGTYEDFRAFLDDVEASLVLMDAGLISIKEDSVGDMMNFDMTLTVYQFVAKPITQ